MLERLAAAAHLHDLNGLAVLDILILAAIIYQILLLIRGSRLKLAPTWLTTCRRFPIPRCSRWCAMRACR